MPEDPTTAESEEEFLVRNGRTGVVIARVPDPGLPEGPSLDNVFPIGSTFSIAVTASANEAPFQAKVRVKHVVISNAGSAETLLNTGTRSGLCP